MTDYGDSVLIPSALVDHTNEEIRKLGGEKVCSYCMLTVGQPAGYGALRFEAVAGSASVVPCLTSPSLY